MRGGEVTPSPSAGSPYRKAANLPDDFDGFDLAIIGITIHQEWEGDNSINQLKDWLHFAQLFISLKYLKPGGMILIRQHMSLRAVDAHFIGLLVGLFDIEKFSGRMGKKNPTPPRHPFLQIARHASLFAPK